ncbi:unannotated protein [freshwater metagenome]|uniref:Unannotated protein n=1 Tax=freshwater metagenome TaxID=449393 RepID=A0A6J6NS25_9ZZZZ
MKSAATMLAILVLAVAAGFLAGRNQHRGTSGDHTVTVAGAGSATAVPDEADFTFGVSNQAKSADEATRTTSEAISRIIAAVKNAGVAEADIQTAQISVYPTTGPNGSNVTGYAASNTVSVKVHTIAKAGSVLDAATGAGANQVNGPTLISSKQNVAYTTALAAAYADAKARATAIADASGEKLGSLRTASEQSSSSPITMSAAKSDTSSTPVEAGTLQIDAQVTVTFDLG